MVLPRYAWKRLYEQRLVLLLTMVSFIWPLLCGGFIYLTNHLELLQGLDKDFLEFIKVNGEFVAAAHGHPIGGRSKLDTSPANWLSCAS